MVVRKKKKQRRGERSYHGSHKKWRGGGSRGGRGQAGMKKHKWSYVVKYDPKHFGKYGFKNPTPRKIKAINLRDLDRMADNLVEQKFAEKQGSKIKIDLEKIGYEKLLGTGKVTKALIVEARYFSKNAVRKLEEAGGEIIAKGTNKN